MVRRKQIMDALNPMRDLDHIPFEWYRDKVRNFDNPDDIDQATAYLIFGILPRCAAHGFRGAFYGGLAGAAAGAVNPDRFLPSLISGMVLGALIDWTQYGLRAMIKLSRAYID